MATPLPISSKDLVRFTPTAYESEPEESRPVYLIAVPTLTSRPRWQRDIEARGAANVSQTRIAAFLRDAVNGCLEGEARSAALEDLETTEQLARREEGDGSEPLTDEGRAELAKLVVRVGDLGAWAARTWPPYAELVAQSDYWWTTARIMAAKHFLRGWENVTEPCGKCESTGKVPLAEEGAEQPTCGSCAGSGRLPLKFKRATDGLVDEALLDRLPRGDVFDIGFKAITLMRPDSERRKN